MMIFKCVIKLTGVQLPVCACVYACPRRYTGNVMQNGKNRDAKSAFNSQDGHYATLIGRPVRLARSASRINIELEIAEPSLVR